MSGLFRYALSYDKNRPVYVTEIDREGLKYAGSISRVTTVFVRDNQVMTENVNVRALMLRFRLNSNIDVRTLRWNPIWQYYSARVVISDGNNGKVRITTARNDTEEDNLLSLPDIGNSQIKITSVDEFDKITGSLNLGKRVF